MNLEVKSVKQQDIVDRFVDLIRELRTAEHRIHMTLKKDEREVYDLEACVNMTRDDV
jgi:hypothetical protein